GSPPTSTRPCARNNASISACGRPPINGSWSLIPAYSALVRAFWAEPSRTLGSNWLSMLTRRPPGRNTRIHSSIAASGCGSVHSTCRLMTRSKLASGNGNCSASASSKRTASDCAAAFRRASASIAGAKSMPVTRWPCAASSRLRNPVPQPASSASSGPRPPTTRSRMRSQAARSAAVLMLWPKPASNPAARRPQWAATCSLTGSCSMAGMSCPLVLAAKLYTDGVPALRYSLSALQGGEGTPCDVPSLQSGQLGQGFEGLGVAADRVEQEVVGALPDQLFELLGDLFRRAVDAGGVGARRVAIDHGEPAQEFLARHLRPLVDRQEHPLRDREGRGVAAGLLQRLLQYRHR